MDMESINGIEWRGRRPFKVRLANYLHRLADNLTWKDWWIVTNNEPLWEKDVFTDKVNKNRNNKKIQAEDVTQEYFDRLWENTEHILSNDLAVWMISVRKISLLAYNLNKFTKLEDEISLALADGWYINEVLDNHSSFYRPFSNDLARKIIDQWKISLLASNLDKFTKLEDDVIWQLLDGWYYEEFTEYAENYVFIDLNVENIKKLIEKWNFDRVIDHVDLDEIKFDDDTLELLIRKWYWEWVIAHYDISSLNTANLIIQQWLWKYLVWVCALDDEVNVEMIKLLIDNDLWKNVIDERCHIDDPNVLQLLFEKGYFEDIASLLWDLIEDEDDVEREIYELYDEYDISY